MTLRTIQIIWVIRISNNRTPRGELKEIHGSCAKCLILLPYVLAGGIRSMCVGTFNMTLITFGYHLVPVVRSSIAKLHPILYIDL